LVHLYYFIYLQALAVCEQGGYINKTRVITYIASYFMSGYF